MSKQLKSIGVVAGLTVVSRVLGLVRDSLSAAVFGASALNSAFVTAFRIPNLFRRLLGEGSLTAALVPALQQELQSRGRSAAFTLVNQAASWVFVLTTGLVLGGMVFCSQSRLFPGQQERWYLGADLTVWLLPYMAFICLAAAFSATLQVLQRFTEGALSPVLLNLAMILSLGGAGLHWADTPLGQMHWLCAGVLVGGFLQLALPAWSLTREGWRPRFDLTLSSGVREIARLMLPGLWGAAVYQVNQVVVQLLAMTVDDASASFLFYTGRLTELPIGVFAIAVSTVVYPLVAKHAACGDYASLAREYLKGLRLILFINLPAAFGLALLAEPIIRVLFERGQFTAADTRFLAPLLAVSVIGLPFFSVVSLSTRVFYALKDTGTPVRVATVSFLVNLGLALVLLKPLGTLGLVAASTVAVLVQCLQLQRLLARRIPEAGLAGLGSALAKMALCVLAMAAGVGLVWWGLLKGGGPRADWFALLVLIPLGALFYGFLAWRLRLDGLEALDALWLRVRSRWLGTRNKEH